MLSKPIGFLLLLFSLWQIGFAQEKGVPKVFASYSARSTYKKVSESEWRQTAYFEPIIFSQLTDSSYRIKSYDFLTDLLGSEGTVVNTSGMNEAVYRKSKLTSMYKDGEFTAKVFDGQLWFNTVEDGKTPVYTKLWLFTKDDGTVVGVHIASSSSRFKYALKF